MNQIYYVLEDLRDKNTDELITVISISAVQVKKEHLPAGLHHNEYIDEHGRAYCDIDIRGFTPMQILSKVFDVDNTLPEKYVTMQSKFIRLMQQFKDNTTTAKYNEIMEYIEVLKKDYPSIVDNCEREIAMERHFFLKDGV